MNFFNQIKQFLNSLIEGKSSTTEQILLDTMSNQYLLEEIKVRIRKLQRRKI